MTKEENTKRQAERAARKIKKGDLDKAKKIKIVVEGNPRREGTAPHVHFAKYKTGMTVENFLSEKVGGEWIHFQADIERGYIELTA